MLWMLFKNIFRETFESTTREYVIIALQLRNIELKIISGSWKCK